MKLRWLETETTTYTSHNRGSRKYPDWGTVTQTETTKDLQFSEDDGVTWQNIDTDYDNVEIDLTHER